MSDWSTFQGACQRIELCSTVHPRAVRTSSRGRAARKAAATARSWGAGRRSAVSQRSRHCGQLAGPDRSWYSMLLRTHPEQTAGTEGLQGQPHCLCDGGAVAYNKRLQPCTAMLRPARNVHIGHGSYELGVWAWTSCIDIRSALGKLRCNSHACPQRRLSGVSKGSPQMGHRTAPSRSRHAEPPPCFGHSSGDGASAMLPSGAAADGTIGCCGLPLLCRIDDTLAHHTCLMRRCAERALSG